MKLCCIFWPVFGCCTLQTLTEICLFHVFVCFHKTVLYMLTSVWMPHTPNAGQSWLFNAGLAPLQTSKKADFEQCLESTLEIAAPKCWSKFTTKKGRELPWRKIVIVQITNILLLSKYRLTNLFYYLNVSSVTGKVTLVFGMASCFIGSIYLGSTYFSLKLIY